MMSSEPASRRVVSFGYTFLMIASGTQNNIQKGLPSRTSILVAAARPLGSREPDENVRNPDSVANLLIGPSELALISDHPVSTGLAQGGSVAAAP
jgi:hypothetical protein